MADVAFHPRPRSRPARALGGARRALLRRRRPLAALLAAVAVAAGLAATRAEPPPAVTVTVAARDLPAGEVVHERDLTTVELPADAVPAGLAAAATGRVLAAPVSRGEPLTEVRLVGAGMTAGRPDLVAVPVRLPDAGAVALLRVGDVVDLVAADPQAGTASTVAPDATVLALPAADDVTGATGMPGRLVVVGVAASEVTDLADATARAMLTYAWAND
ncbi:SAF domain-containing protein [Nocardioides sp. 1609]|uniref:SAF domain-containing protein n=1 Tax=Nocardioides sp. 1609 TaxID=2508327 RepID=UPI00106F69B6|nr:SAF domain-containing protein [Nocardioides sp. 1609]